MGSKTAKSLAGRIQALERAAQRAAPRKRNRLLDLSFTAMVLAWSPDELEAILSTAERSKLDDLPANLRHRWVRCLDQISLQQFGKDFGGLLACQTASTSEPNDPCGPVSRGSPPDIPQLIANQSIKRKEP